MASGREGAILGHVHRIFGVGGVTGLGEGQLLERFVAGRDELAFEALVARLGPMVLGVCRRRLADPRDVEDAFQATFLVLVRKAGSIRDRDRLAPWLYGVAQRVATRARAQAARRRGRERSAGAEAEAMAPACDGDRHELRSVLDEEIGRLPAKYRGPIVLCYLNGLTHEEAAARLRCPVGTVRSRLAWARDRLRARLGRRGLAPAEGMIGLALRPTAVPRALIESTVAGGIRLAAGKAAAAGAVSAGAVTLAEGVSRTMIATKLRVCGGRVGAAGLGAGGAGVLARQAGGPPATPPVAEPAPAGEDGDPAPNPAEFRRLRQRADAMERRQTDLEEEVRALRRLLSGRADGPIPAPTATPGGAGSLTGPPRVDPPPPPTPPAGLPGAGGPTPTTPGTPGGPPGRSRLDPSPTSPAVGPRAEGPGAGGGAPPQVQSVNNLKQIGLALHNYHALNNKFPPQATRDPAGRPLLSWRVALLPYLDQQALFEEFLPDEPWDSAHNKALLKRMPAVFALPGTKAESGMTFYQVIAGAGSGFDPAFKQGVGLAEMTDGSSNTMAVVEAKDAVFWTKPADLPFFANPGTPQELFALRKRLGDHFDDGFHALFFDGAVKLLKGSIAPSLLRSLITRGGNEVVDTAAF